MAKYRATVTGPVEAIPPHDPGRLPVMLSVEEGQEYEIPDAWFPLLPGSSGDGHIGGPQIPASLVLIGD